MSNYDLQKAELLLSQGKKLKFVSEELKIPYSYLAKLSCQKGWSKKGKETVKKIVKKTVEKTIEKASEKNSDKVANYLEINSKAKGALEEYFNNGDYKKAVVKTKKPFLDKEGKPVLDGKGHAIMVETIEIVDTPYVDPVALRHAIEGLKTTNLTDRLNKGLITKLEQEKLDLERQRLELEKKKNEPAAEPEIEDDGFIDALTPHLTEIWQDHEDN